MTRQPAAGNSRPCSARRLTARSATRSRRTATRCRRSATRAGRAGARLFARAEHLYLDAAVGLQAIHELAVLRVLGAHVLARVAGDRLALAAAFGLHDLRVDALVREVHLH